MLKIIKTHKEMIMNRLGSIGTSRGAPKLEKSEKFYLGFGQVLTIPEPTVSRTYLV